MATRPSPALANAVAPGVRVDHIEPLQRRIERNRLRFLAFMALFTVSIALAAALFLTLTFLVVGFLVLPEVPEFGSVASAEPGRLVLAVAASGFALGFAGALGWALLRLAQSETSLLGRLGAHVPKGGTLLPTKSVLRDMAIAAGLPKVPLLYVIDTPRVNAFVVGRTPERARIGVTTGFVERIDIEEQRAVFANLVARVLSRDTLWATAVSAIVGPIWAMRDYDLRYEPSSMDEGLDANMRVKPPRHSDWRFAALPVYGLFVVLTELLSYYHQEAAWRAAEKADAEGMMLLKDPRSMLRAIEHVLDRDNHVPTAGDAYSQLFFCWAGFGFAPEDDPEMRRVARMRETLGAEGAPYVPRPNVPDWSRPPLPPRLDAPTGTREEPGDDSQE